MLVYKSLLDVTFSQAIQVWNEGFQGYFVDVSMNAQRYFTRFGQESLSPELSVVAFQDDVPIGFVLNGSREILGKRVVWNGGTGVIPAYRRQGVAKRLMDECMKRYANTTADLAYLEALEQNVGAIRLYESVGYQVVDGLIHLGQTGPLTEFEEITTTLSQVRYGASNEVTHLPFYRAFASWQTQWQSVLSGQSAILRLADGTDVAYALFKHHVNDEGHVQSITLYQCEVSPQIAYPVDAIKTVLMHALSPSLSCRRVVVNMPESNQHVLSVLQAWGFQSTVRQVMMCKNLR